MDLVEILGWAVFFYMMWQLLSAWILVQRLRHKVEDAIEEQHLEEEIEKRVIALRFEHVEVNDYKLVLAYGKNNKFLGQGSDESEAISNLQKYYPRHKLVVVNDKATITKIVEPAQTTNG